MGVNIEDIKRLKELTGVGLTSAKKALEEVDGDYDKALEALRVKGLAKADKKAEREAREGKVASYVHSDRIGVLVEVNCETDFVARTDNFQDFVKDVAMHIAASNPRYLSSADIPAEDLEKERELSKQELAESGKPAEMIDKIVEGKLKKWYSEVCLSNQAFVKDPDMTIEELTKSMVAKLGENIVVRRFNRIELGEA